MLNKIKKISLDALATLVGYFFYCVVGATMILFRMLDRKYERRYRENRHGAAD